MSLNECLVMVLVIVLKGQVLVLILGGSNLVLKSMSFSFFLIIPQVEECSDLFASMHLSFLPQSMTEFCKIFH